MDYSYRLLCIFSILYFTIVLASDDISIGVGSYDITGPAAELDFMGYGAMDQLGSGIHMRLKARSFIFAQPRKRVVFTSIETCMIFPEVKFHVLEKLKARYGDLYKDENLMISATHTHSGPGGFTSNILYAINTFGFSHQCFDVIVDGIYHSIVKAHDNLLPKGKILLNIGELKGISINRSPASYLQNPAEERAKYKYNTDKEVNLLRLQAGGKDVGMVHWFAVHGVSLIPSNTLVSSDNKGYASQLFEREMNKGIHGDYVASFVQPNSGDATPNTGGAFCPDGTPCDFNSSTCGGKNEDCHGRGPGYPDYFESSRIVGRKQYENAKELFDYAVREVRGDINYVHRWIDTAKHPKVTKEFSTSGKDELICDAALGDAFAGGTSDGPGILSFVQHSIDGHITSASKFANWLFSFLSPATKDQETCQYPKPILINIAKSYLPVQWSSTVVPYQVFSIGNLYIIGFPGEVTTMSGRHIRDAVIQSLKDSGDWKEGTSHVILAGLCNDYIHYSATYHEYQFQRYEGGSTMFGPFSVDFHSQTFYNLVRDLVSGNVVQSDPAPADLTSKAINLRPPVIVDTAPLFKKFGDVKTDVKSWYKIGDTVSVEFWGAHLANDLMTEKTFLAVEKKIEASEEWELIADDSLEETKLHWKRNGISESIVTVEWTITSGIEPAVYRIRHFGNSRSLLGTITPFVGTSKTFSVFSLED